MGRPVEKVVDGSVERALDVIDESVQELEEDIENLTEFQDAVEDMDISGVQPPSSSDLAIQQSQAKSDSEKVIELYREHFFPEDEYPEEVDKYAEKFGISTVAADFFDEVTRAANINKKDALAKISFLDEGNSMTHQHLQEVVSLTEYPKALRRSVNEDVEVEKESLNHYRNEVQEIEDRLLELNRRYTLPMDVNNAVEVVENLEQLEDRVQNVKNRREHELRRRPDILDGYFERNLEKFYDDEEFGAPVLRDLDQLQEGINKAYDNLVI